MPSIIWHLPSWQCEVSISVQSISRLHTIWSPDSCDSWILCLQEIQSELTYKIKCLEIIFSRFIVCTRSIDFWQTIQFWKTNWKSNKSLRYFTATAVQLYSSPDKNKTKFCLLLGNEVMRHGRNFQSFLWNAG